MHFLFLCFRIISDLNCCGKIPNTTIQQFKRIWQDYFYKLSTFMNFSSDFGFWLIFGALIFPVCDLGFIGILLTFL